VCVVDLAHAAHAEQGEDFVVTKFVADRQRPEYEQVYRCGSENGPSPALRLIRKLGSLSAIDCMDCSPLARGVYEWRFLNSWRLLAGNAACPSRRPGHFYVQPTD
jgi:hypothetical protein